MTASCSTASSRASWPRPAIRPAPAPAARNIRIFRPSSATRATFERGTIGAARSSDPNSANSQFFIDFAPAPFLNGQYTIWGQVIDGMNAVDKIKPGEPPSNPDKIIKMQIASDADEASKKAATAVLKAQQ